MKVTLNMSDGLELGNNGIDLEVRDPSGIHLGTLRIGRARVTWIKTRARIKATGIKLEDVIKFVEERQIRQGSDVGQEPSSDCAPQADECLRAGESDGSEANPHPAGIGPRLVDVPRVAWSGHGWLQLRDGRTVNRIGPLTTSTLSYIPGTLGACLLHRGSTPSCRMRP
jgi:hypothetical protein